MINRLKYYVLQLGDPNQDWVLGPSWRGFVSLFSVSMRLFVFFCFPPGIFPSAKGCPRPKEPRKPVFCDFSPLGIRLAKSQIAKKLHNFCEKFWGGQIFSPNVPLAPGNCVFLPWPGIYPSAKGCPRPKGPRKPVFFDFPPVGVRSAKTQNVKKSHFFWEKLLGRTEFSPKSASSTGKWCFSVFGPEFL